MIRIPFRVANRFSEPLGRAQLRVRINPVLGTTVEAQGSANEKGSGTLLVNAPFGIGVLEFDFHVLWTDSDGVAWGYGSHTKTELVPVPNSPDVRAKAEVGFVVTTRAFPQALPLPEIDHVTRARLLSVYGWRSLHQAYEEARDSMVAGLPNSAAAMLGKTLETAIYLRGEARGWPVEEWKNRPAMLGGLLVEPLVKADIVSTFSSGFYRKLNAANVVRILGAHQAGEGVNMDDSRAALKQVTQLIDGWFGALLGPPPGV